MKVLNLYAGVGGNRKLWKGCDVTAVEYSPEIAEVYQGLYPEDTVVVGDAHQYLLDHHHEFDFIWSSPPCQSHSRMMKATRHKLNRYPDMKLYEEILLLQHFYKGKWVVENVVPYYTPLIEAKKVGRHLFWSNFDFTAEDIARPKDFINTSTAVGKEELMNWLGIYFTEKLYYEGSHDLCQVLRNCVHPELGRQLFEEAQQ